MPPLLPRVDRLILNEIVGPFLLSVLMFTTLFFAADDLQKIFVFVQNGESAGVVLRLIAYALPMVLAFTIPMAMLLATLLGFGRLSGDSEVIAMLAAGVSLPRIMAPVLAFSLAVAAPLVVANHTVIPAAVRARQALIDDLKKKGGLSTRGAFDYSSDSGDNARLALHAEGGVRLGDGGVATMRGVSITVYKNGQAHYTVNADEARWKVDSQTWELDGNVWSSSREPALVLFGDQVQTREYALKSPDELAALERPVNEVGTQLLYDRARVLRASGRDSLAREAEIEAARRVSFPLASVVFALVGAPLGIQPPRTGKGLGFGLSVLITFLYWTLTQVLVSVGKGGSLSPMAAAFLPNIIGLIAGILLIRQKR